MIASYAKDERQVIRLSCAVVKRIADITRMPSR
jgi:hypothetical protein